MQTQIHPFNQQFNTNQYNTSQKARKVIENFSYGLTDEIGKGFSSKVFKGKNDITGELVAVKVIDLQMLKTPLHHALLKSEIEALSIVNHPNIMKLHKVFQTQNNTYLITEYCDNGDLASAILKTGKQPENKIQIIMYGIVQAYKEMKRKGIIHRDLKPANILLQNGVPKIADFGFATTPNSPPMLPNVNVGSPLYMSPQALKQNRYSDKSDIWAIGVSVYELLCGQVPWQASSEKELAQRIVSVPAIFPQGVILSHECQDFIKQCLIVDEHNRISIEEMENHSWLSNISSIQSSKLMQTPGTHFQNKNFSKQQITSSHQSTEQTSNTTVLGEVNKDFSLNQQGRNKIDYFGKENNVQKRAYFDPTSVQQKEQMVLNQEFITVHTITPQRQTSVGRNLVRQHTQIYEPEQMKRIALSINNQVLDPSYHTQRNLLIDQSQPFPNQQISQNIQQKDTTIDFKRNDNILLSQINFCRYLHRVGNLIVKVPFITQNLVKEKISFFVQKNIMIKIEKLRDMINNRNNNSLGLSSFNEYVNSNSFNKISQVILSYCEKFQLTFSTTWLNLQQQRSGLQQDKKFDAIFDENLTEFESFYIILLSVLRSTVQELNSQLEQTLKVRDKEPDCQLPLQVEEGVVLLDYLVTYFQLTTLILDQFNEYEVFATQSKIEQIADGKPVRLTYGHFLEIRNKILQLEI